MSCSLSDKYSSFADALDHYKGLTEPNHGSDPGSMETTAEEVDGGFIINGSKTWISNAPVAQVYIQIFHLLNLWF